MVAAGLCLHIGAALMRSYIAGEEQASKKTWNSAFQ